MNGPLTNRLATSLLWLTGFLFINGLYLLTVSALEWMFTLFLQNQAYQIMFAAHLIVGIVFTLTLVVYVVSHLRAARARPDSHLRKHGKQLAYAAGATIVSGVLLTQGISGFEIHRPEIRWLLYSLHVLLPFIAIFLFVRHRPSIRLIEQLKKWPLQSIALILIAIAPLTIIEESEQRDTLYTGESGSNSFPSLIKTASGSAIEPERLMNDEYCLQCHADTHERWQASAHHLSSFNNPFYRFALMETREFLMQRDGNTHASRFCAGCHDVVPLLSGEFDQPGFDLHTSPSASAGITCTVCHAITSVDSTRGNADFTITPPSHYPFATSEMPELRWLSNMLLKANPDWHKRTFLKPLHQSAEFCGSCHKVHIPEALNEYRWLRGQNHYDSFLLSGVSGHRIDSFYYPKTMQGNCNDCHMPAMPSDDFGARPVVQFGETMLHDHLFVGANTALSTIQDDGSAALQAHQAFLKDSVSVDFIGMRLNDETDTFIGPLDTENLNKVPVSAGQTVDLDIVLRTRTLGHMFTQGTSDSNQVWLEVEVFNEHGKLVAQNGVLNADGTVPNDAHTVNVYMLDRFGNKVDRRNVEDIFTPLFNNQIPPGAAGLARFELLVPTGTRNLTVEARLRYRKFDTHYVQLVNNNTEPNPLPITTISSTTVDLQLDGTRGIAPKASDWQRLNDYGIALLRSDARSQFKQAEAAFHAVARLGRYEGHLNLVRLNYNSGYLNAASRLLTEQQPGADDAWWTAAWYSALIDLDTGYVTEGIAKLEALLADDDKVLAQRGLDFTKDYNLLNRLGQAYLNQSGAFRDARSQRMLDSARDVYEQVLAIDSENAQAHFGLSQVYAGLDEPAKSSVHHTAHLRYKPDDNAQETVLAIARESATLDMLSRKITRYPLHSPTER